MAPVGVERRGRLPRRNLVAAPIPRNRKRATSLTRVPRTMRFCATHIAQGAGPEVHIDADLLRIPIGPGAMHVARFGHGGPPILLVHGFGTCSFLWRHVGPLLAEAACTAYAIDLFGHGESDRPYDADFSIAAQSEYLDTALTALRLPRATIVGVDLGGGVALRLAATRPDRVERLILINSIALDEVAGTDLRTLNRNTARFVLRVSQGVMGAAPLLAPILQGSVVSPDHMPPRLVARYLAPYVGREGVSHLLVLARSIRAADLEELDLRAVRAPTLILWGEEDKWLDPRLPDRLANALPGSRLVRFPGLARLLPEEDPSRVAEEIIGFIRETVGTG